MLSGLQILQGFDDRLRRAQTEAAAAQQETDRLALRRDALRATEANALGQLARMRLTGLRDSDPDALTRLDEASGRALTSLEQRRQAVVAADAELVDLAAFRAGLQRVSRKGKPVAATAEPELEVAVNATDPASPQLPG